ncbi:MAG: hypothetical protein ACE5JU_23015 [Candidatus Binatia bacterium]
MKAKRYKSTLHGEEMGGASGNELPERWSVQRKTEVVLRLLRGELLEDVSRENQIPAHELARISHSAFVKLSQEVSVLRTAG